MALCSDAEPDENGEAVGEPTGMCVGQRCAERGMPEEESVRPVSACRGSAV